MAAACRQHVPLVSAERNLQPSQRHRLGGRHLNASAKDGDVTLTACCCKTLHLEALQLPPFSKLLQLRILVTLLGWSQNRASQQLLWQQVHTCRPL